MYLIRTTPIFDDWFSRLKDYHCRARLIARLHRAARGNLGDHKAVGGGVSEMRIDCGPGYRVYYTIRDRQLLLLLVGGDKSSQSKDIQLAYALAASM
ncbi:type II toxin-antitoxin system RelE/ParE family toxin [Massilia sp. BJB1822]|uniref:type II toxin-antitoxin system RelE/ParE family toxin n=1 Tax=Massilia sp. BJB1822 TaxID=2744470 RepID=UPI001594DB0A|nr:type II toxin-antitoxin system RelE/ParE family toxin [Massilia sp. BJB1822]NVE00615.1 type II toxin-antitoxin system RelE/ParE family toxin [Massilia sp. BJB1822]